MGLPDLPEQNDDDGTFCMGEDNIINIEVATDDSENESVEETEYMGYQPLSINDGHEMLLDDDCELEAASMPDTSNSAHEQHSNQEFLNVDVWNAPRPDVLSIEIDPAKAEQIVSVMAGFNLPTTSVPEWAVGIPEERWKEDLLQRIRQRQHTCTIEGEIPKK